MSLGIPKSLRIGATFEWDSGVIVAMLQIEICSK